MVHFKVDFPFFGKVPNYQLLVESKPEQQDGHDELEEEDDYSAKECEDMKQIRHRLVWFYLAYHCCLTVRWYAYLEHLRQSNNVLISDFTIFIAMIIFAIVIVTIQLAYTRERMESADKLKVLYV